MTPVAPRRAADRGRPHRQNIRQATRTAARLLACLPLWLSMAPAGAAGGGLPPEPLLRQSLQQAPEAAAAAADADADAAVASQLRLGPHDWVLRAGLARRSERGGDSFGEREIAIERTLRWGRKPAQDAALADLTLQLATLRRRAAWHDSAGRLLDQWFDARRDQQAERHQQQQWQLAQAQVAALQRRVAAGDAAALSLRQAEGELARTGAALAAAAQRAQASRQALLARHPLLAQAWDTAATDAAVAADGVNGVVNGVVSGLVNGTPDIAAAPAQAAVAALLEAHPMLAVARAELALARQQLDRLQADRVADPTLGLRLAQERGGAERVVGLTVSMPFGTALRDSRVDAGSAALARAEAQCRSLQQQAAIDATALSAGPAQAATVLQRLQAAATAADTSARLTQKAQAVGEATLGELLLQQRLAGDSRLAADLAALDLQQAHARLRLAQQRLLPAAP